MSMTETQHIFRYTHEFSDTIIASAGGAVIRDREGREILDFTSGQMSSILGHAHPEIVTTVRDGIERLDHVHSSFLSDPVIECSESKIVDSGVGTLDSVAPIGQGESESVDSVSMAVNGRLNGL